MVKRLIPILMIFLGALLSAMEWPMPEAELVSNFGLNDRGRPSLGMSFEGEGEVQAADAGEIIFVSSGNNAASRLPSPLGAWTAVDHGDGLVSIYGRYRDDDKNSAETRAVLGSPIADAGSSGWSGRDGFYFMLYDRRERRWVNASMVITPFPDAIPPQIPGIQLINSNGRLIESSQLRGIGQGKYTILVNAFDTMQEKGLPIAPHRIVASVNGVEVGALNFETISARDGVLMVNRNGLVPALQVYAPFPAYEVGEVQLSRGQAILEIIVQDIAGNSRSAVYRITVE